MLLLLSGEGATDIGVSRPNEDSGEAEFVVGPMAVLADTMIEGVVGFSVLELGLVEHIGRGELSNLAKNAETKPRLLIPGVKRPTGFAGEYRQAYALAGAAKELADGAGDKVVAIMFRDSDGTQSDRASRFEDLAKSIEAGFVAAEFETGVAMIAKPKQEAWLLCAVKENPYVGCEILEDESGNDNSPAALKTQLASIIGEHGAEELIELVETRFDHTRVDMSSFNRFRDALESTLARL